VILGKMALTALALLVGASVGREGPTVQVGAAVMLLCARIGGIGHARGILLAGAAAGVAAAFNTPLAGIVFAIEEMARSFEHRNSGRVLAAIVLAAVAAISVLGNYDYFGVATAHFDLIRDLLPTLIVGVAGGIGGALFARALADGSRFLRRAGKGFFARYPAGFGAACGLVIAVIGIASHGATYGTGYQLANDLLHEKYTVSWATTAAKFVATALSNMSGIPGGLFSPSLTVGAALGSNLSPWFPHTPLQLVVLLGMVAYFAGVTQAPITAFVIVLEVTGKSVMPVPLILAALIATAVSRLFNPVSLYHVLAERFIAETRRLLAAREMPAAAQHANGN
jgi:H+/Cl- antiporter ClcA